MSEIVYETHRTLVRRWRKSDLADLLIVYGDADAMRWVDDGKPISQSEAESWLNVTATNYQLRGYGMFAVELREKAKIIGFCGLVHPGEQKDPEIKYAYLRIYWGCGIATEVAEGAIKYGATVHGMDRIIATAAPENVASHRVLLKAGIQEGELRENGDGSQTQYFMWERIRPNNTLETKFDPSLTFAAAKSGAASNAPQHGREGQVKTRIQIT